MTGRIFGNLGNESLRRIKFDALKSNNNFQERHLILAALPRLLTWRVNIARQQSALFMAQVITAGF